MRSSGWLQRLDDPALRARAEVRVLVRALLGTMPELRLHSLDGLPACDGLARHRMPADLVMAERPQTELALHQLQRPHMAVDEAREGASLGEEKLGPRVARSHVPVDRVEDVLGDAWARKVLIALLRRYQLKSYRLRGQRRSTDG